MCSECAQSVQSVFRVCSECVQGVFRVCSILKSFHHLVHLVCQFFGIFLLKIFNRPHSGTLSLGNLKKPLESKSVKNGDKEGEK